MSKASIIIIAGFLVFLFGTYKISGLDRGSPEYLFNLMLLLSGGGALIGCTFYYAFRMYMLYRKLKTMDNRMVMELQATFGDTLKGAYPDAVTLNDCPHCRSDNGDDTDICAYCGKKRR